jgi:hypothetical protein
LTIDPAAIRPDHVAAVIARLRQFSDLLALCPDDPPDAKGKVVKRIGKKASPFVKDGATHMIAVNGAPSPQPDLYVPRSRPVVDIHCYATQGHEAARLAYLVLAALCPDWRGQAFTAANCRIIDVFPLTAAPIEIFDRDLKLDDRVLSFELDKSEVPA